MTSKLKIIIATVFIALLCAGMFYFGRTTVKITEVTETKYLPGDPIINSVPAPYPVIKEVPAKVDTASLLKYCIDNGLYSYLIPREVKEVVIYEKVDTMAILSDWLTKRNYEFTVFENDTLGTFVARPEVQYNKLQNFEYTFTPVNKVTNTVKEKKRKFEVYGGLGMNTNAQIVFNGGFFTSSGLGAGVVHSDNFKGDRTTGLMVVYKF